MLLPSAGAVRCRAGCMSISQHFRLPWRKQLSKVVLHPRFFAHYDAQLLNMQNAQCLMQHLIIEQTLNRALHPLLPVLKGQQDMQPRGLCHVAS